tara:strand:+ start:182 stop:853 length:672 start_codon:yes stop_codon:yes gene_type:complete
MLFRKKYNIEDIGRLTKLKSPERKNYSIVIIDDDLTMAKKELLGSLGFVVTILRDIDNINEIQNFDIIVCDVRGVGKKYDSKYGGAFIIKEIAHHYPQKYIIVCSGSTFKVNYAQYFRLADSELDKGSDSTEWAKVLDGGIKNLSSPELVWERTRKNFITNEVPTEIINKIEQAFIKSIVKKDSQILDKLVTKNQNLLSNEYVAFAANSLVSYTSSILGSLIA